MATIDEITNPKGKKVFRVRVRMKGSPAQTATFDRKTDARIWAQQTEMSIREGKHFKYRQAKRHLLSDLIERYVEEVLPLKPKSYKDQKQQLEVWRKEIGHLAHKISKLNAKRGLYFNVDVKGRRSFQLFWGETVEI